MVAAYPVLAGKLAERGIKKKVAAEVAHITPKAFHDKMAGRYPFTMPEAFSIRDTLFPDMSVEVLFTVRTDEEALSGSPTAE